MNKQTTYATNANAAPNNNFTGYQIGMVSGSADTPATPHSWNFDLFTGLPLGSQLVYLIIGFVALFYLFHHIHKYG